MNEKIRAPEDFSQVLPEFLIELIEAVYFFYFVLVLIAGSAIAAAVQIVKGDKDDQRKI